MTDYTLRLIIEAIDRASGPLGGFGRSLGALGREADSLLGDLQPLGTALTGVGAAGLGLAASSVLTAARTEELGLVLNVMADNAREAAIAEGDLDRASQLTTESVWDSVESLRRQGISRQVALQLTSQFVRYELDMAQATDLGRVAQDAAVISMQDSSEALAGMLHGILTYNPVVLRTYGLNVQAAESFRQFAATNGIAVEEMDNTQRAQAMLNGVLEEGTSITGAYEAAMGSAGKQLRSLTGREFQEFREEFGEALLPLMGDAVTATRDLIHAYQDLSPAQQAVITRYVTMGSALALATGGTVKLLPHVLSLGQSLGALAGFGGDVVYSMRLINVGAAPLSLGLAGVTAVALPLVAAIGALAVAHIAETREAQRHEDAILGDARAVEIAYDVYTRAAAEIGIADAALIESTYGALEAREQHSEVIRLATLRYQELEEEIVAAQESQSLGTQAIYESAQAEMVLIDRLRAYHAAAREAALVSDDLTLSFRDEYEALDYLGREASEATDAENALTEATREAADVHAWNSETVNLSAGALRDAGVAGWEYERAQLALALATGEMTVAEAGAQQAVAETAQLYAAGTITLTEYVAQIQAVRAAWAEVPADVTTIYHVEVEGAPPGPGGTTPGGIGWYQHGTPYVPHDTLAFLHESEAVLNPAQAAAYRAGDNITNRGGDTYNYNLYITTTAGVEDIAQDFDLMRAMAGA